MKLGVDLSQGGVTRGSAVSRSKPGHEHFRVLDWTKPERAVVLIERHDLVD